MKKSRKYFKYSFTYSLLSLIFIIISLIYLICFDGFGTPISYLLYLLMSYSLFIVVSYIVRVIKNKINNIIEKNIYLKRYKNDYILRYRISLIVSVIINIIYTLFKFISGIYYKSIWFIVFSLYYLLLVILRVNIIKEEIKKHNKKNEYKVYRKTGIYLLVTNVILSMIILVIVNESIMNIYSNSMAITVAVYTFYLIISSIISLIKYRKTNSVLVISSKVINVVNSLVGIISLETVLIPTFGNDLVFFRMMIMSTGLLLAISISTISLYMIIWSSEFLNN